MGLFFFHNSLSKACSRPLGPKGSFFSFFIYLFEFLLIIIHLNQLNTWKILNLSFSNLFVHIISSKIRAWSDMEELELIGYDLYKIAWKKIEKRSWKIKSFKPWMLRFLIDFFDLDHSYISTKHNPNAINHKVALETKNKTWLFGWKTKIWKQG